MNEINLIDIFIQAKLKHYLCVLWSYKLTSTTKVRPLTRILG